jgi:hypothetical protein
MLMREGGEVAGPVDGALARLLLAVLAGVVVGWLGVAALLAVSIVWPTNQVPHVLLGIWLCLIAAGLVLPGRPGPSDNWPKRIAYAPLVGLVFWVGLRVQKARRLTPRLPRPPVDLGRFLQQDDFREHHAAGIDWTDGSSS